MRALGDARRCKKRSEQAPLNLKKQALLFLVKSKKIHVQIRNEAGILEVFYVPKTYNTAKYKLV